jgi:putative transposase
MTADIVIDALTMTWLRRRPEPAPCITPTMVAQYASHDFRCKLTEYGMRWSMSRKGKCWGAPTESFFNSLKSERVHVTR